MVDSVGPTLGILSRVLTQESQSQADRSLERLLLETNGAPDPSRLEDVTALRIWLNAWSCRIPYPRNSVDLLKSSLVGWWTNHRLRLPSGPLIDLDDRGLDDLADAYSELVPLPAGVNRVGGIRSLAPTASSKLLWVLRPQTACPWDTAIARAGGRGTQKAGYANHLRKARDWTRQITAEATTQGIADVAAHVGRPNSTLVKLYDEWCYMTMTRGAT